MSSDGSPSAERPPSAGGSPSSDGLAAALSPTGWALLSQLPPYDAELALRLGSGLRERGVPADVVAGVLTQSRLRAEGRAKFGDFAEGMVFTRAGLEQATRLSVAAHHARRYADAGVTRVADLTCGIGAESMALAGLGMSVLAVDIDPDAVAAATMNLRHFPEAEVRHDDALTTDLSGVDALFADPGRRTDAGRRIHDPRQYRPALDRLLALCAPTRPIGVKVSPGIEHRLLPPESHAQWVSVDGDVVEAGLWFGALAPEGPGRSALVLRGNRAHLFAEDAFPAAVLADDAPDRPGRPSQATADAPVRPGEVRTLGAYLYEPDGAVIRAGLVAQLAERLDGGLVSPGIAYVTGDEPRTTPFATGYRVLDSFDFSLKRLRAYLRERGVGSLTVKKRGSALDPDELRRRLSLRGPASATIVLTRLGERHRVIVVEPGTGAAPRES